MENVLMCIRVFLYVVSIILIVMGIRIKNKDNLKDIRFLSMLNIFYVFLSTFFLPEILGLESDLGDIIIYGASTIAIAVSIASVIITNIKYNKGTKLVDKGMRLSVFKYTVVLLPIIFFIGSFGLEISAIMGAKAVIVSNYQNGIVISETSKYAISDKSVKQVFIDPNYINRDREVYEEVYYYDISNELGSLEIKSKYHDPELDDVDVDLLKKIFNDEKYDSAYIGYFVGTNYFVVDYLEDNSVEKSVIYNGDKRVSEAHISGDLEYLILYK